MDKVIFRLEATVLRHFNALHTSKLIDEPYGEAAYAMYGNMSRKVEAFPWAVVLKEAVRRDAESGHVRQVRLMVDETKEYGLCSRHPCVDFYWAPDPD